MSAVDAGIHLPLVQFAELLSRYAAAGCQRVFFWPMGDERRQVERVAEIMQLS
jgi:hypothetical protein